MNLVPYLDPLDTSSTATNKEKHKDNSLKTLHPKEIDSFAWL